MCRIIAIGCKCKVLWRNVETMFAGVLFTFLKEQQERVLKEFETRTPYLPDTRLALSMTVS